MPQNSSYLVRCSRDHIQRSLYRRQLCGMLSDKPGHFNAGWMLAIASLPTLSEYLLDFSNVILLWSLEIHCMILLPGYRMYGMCLLLPGRFYLACHCAAHNEVYMWHGLWNLVAYTIFEHHLRGHAWPQLQVSLLGYTMCCMICLCGCGAAEW